MSMTLRLAGLGVLLLFAYPASSALETKVLKSTADFPKALQLRAVKNVKTLQPLAKVQWYATQERWQNCVEASEGVAKDQSLGVWVPYQWLVCLQGAYSTPSSWKVERFIDSFEKLSPRTQEVLNSPYPSHRETLLQVFLELAELALDKARDRFDSFVQANQSLVDYMNEEQRAKYYRLMGEIAWLRQKNDIATNNFLRSYEFQADDRVLQRLKQLKADRSLKLDKYQNSFSESDEENKLWGKFARAVKRGQTFRVADYGADFLNRFPGSKRVNEVQEEINTHYKRLLYRRGKKYIAVKRDFERQLKQAPPQHIMHWATEAYERGYQSSSYTLADRAADKWEGTAYAADALLMAGRSAYYLNKRSKARSLFLDLIEKHGGHPAADEATYLLGLLYFREKEYKKVISLYDTFLTSSGSDKWELQVRYWLWRSLRKIDSRRAADIAESIFRHFPLTYYGLIVRMAEKKGLQNLFVDASAQGEAPYWWTGHTEQRWQRIRKLLEAGWVEAAETEIDFLPDPKTGGAYLVRAQLWQSA
jgi:tetratricopeptide (TPR) repeat protein